MPAAEQHHRRIPELASCTLALGAALLVASDGGGVARVLRVVVVVAATPLLARAAPRAAAAPFVLVVAAAATTAGLGLAVAHLAKAGLDTPAAAGLLLGAGGLVLFGSTGWTAFRHASGLGKAVLPILGLAALLGTAELVAIPVLVTNVPATEGSRVPVDVGLEASDVRIPAGKGVELAAWYVPPRNGTVAILLHGSGSTRAATLPHAAVLVEHGFGALLLDARGHGESGGRAMDLGWQGDADVTAAIDWLDARSGAGDRPAIALVGLSMGGEEAIGAADADHRVGAVVAEGATGRVADDHGWLSDRYGLRGALQELVEHGQEAVVDLLTDARPPPPLRTAAAAAGIPMLLIAAGDIVDEPLAARYVEAAAPTDVDVWVVAGSGHGDALATDPAAWEERVVGFLEQAGAAADGR